jgi:glutamyl-Q tRNA(Asp) synthetase
LSEPVFRFAPSPNGLLHLGHAYSALLNHDLARRFRGRMLLRIDDIDGERCRPEFAAAIEEDCRWLGVDYERPVDRQSQHLPDYAAVLERLLKADLAYPAFMSRGEVGRAVAGHDCYGDAWSRDPDGSPHYPADDRNLDRAEAAARIAAGEPHSFRLDTAKAMAAAGPLTWTEFDPADPASDTIVAARPEEWGDVLLAGRDVPASYHLAVVVDDHRQAVTHVVRGRDLRAATSVHRLLQALLGLPAPRYHHHRLILDESGRKLAKCDRATGLAALRRQGLSPADIREAVGLPAGED